MTTDTVTDLIPVTVQSRTVYIADDPHPLVPLRPFCEILGISWQGQQAKVRKHLTFAPTVKEILTVGADGKLRKMVALPIHMFMGWLTNIYPNKVKPAARPALVSFQTEFFTAGYATWAACRAGLPLHTGGRPQADLFVQAPPANWLQHPTVQAAVALRRQAQQIDAQRAAERRTLRVQGNRLVHALGLKAGDLDFLARLVFFPPAPVPIQPSFAFEEG